MKSLKIIALAIALITLFSSCQSGTDVKQILSNQDTRKDIMNSIAADHSMSVEMMAAMMNGEHGKMIMHDKSMMMMKDHSMMQNMMKNDPGMMKDMMNDMMESCKNDSTKMSEMCRSMMGNKPMMDMMNKMQGKDMDMNHNMKH
ncbi:MAG: hypothetical protein RO257_12055 [Candidatus Kapabacteria bacterium]|nr:hypothetical protein [Candidatus Kapabacteria bacterium]